MSRTTNRARGEGGLTGTVIARASLAEAVLALAAAAVGAAVAGGPGAASVAVGVVVVTALFAGGMAVVASLVRVTTVFAGVGAVGFFAVQMFLLLIVVELLWGVDWLHRGAFVGGALWGTLVWQVVMTHTYRRARQLRYDVPSGQPHGSIRTREEGRDV